jgi:hypothetical protein
MNLRARSANILQFVSKNDVKRMTSSGLMSDAVAALGDQVRKRYEPWILAVGTLPETQVLCGLCVRLYRLNTAARAMNQAGLGDEVQAIVRSAAESIVNLAYILDVGPSRPRESKTSNELADMFLAYGDVAFFKLIGGHGAFAKEALKRGQNWNDAQVDAHFEDCKRKSDNAIAKGCKSSSWHPLGLANMAKQVLQHLPPYIDDRFANSLFCCFTSGNSATHGDALFLRTYYRGQGALPLESVDARRDWGVDAVAGMVTWAWKRQAMYFNDLEWMDQCLDDELRRLALELHDATPS